MDKVADIGGPDGGNREIYGNELHASYEYVRWLCRKFDEGLLACDDRCDVSTVLSLTGVVCVCDLSGELCVVGVILCCMFKVRVILLCIEVFTG